MRTNDGPPTLVLMLALGARSTSGWGHPAGVDAVLDSCSFPAFSLQMIHHRRPWLVPEDRKVGAALEDSRRETQMERGKRRSLWAVLIFLLAFCSFLVPLYLFRGPSSAIIPLCSYLAAEPETILPSSSDESREASNQKSSTSSHSSAPEKFISCDRSGFSSDVCVLRGDARISPSSSSVYLYDEDGSTAAHAEKIRPYTRKWDTKLMEKINEVEVSVLNRSSENNYPCEVLYPVPAVVFSIGGFTGNVYHAFNDALIPLFITSYKYQRKVVFIVFEYQSWWLNKYRDIISSLSAYPPIEFRGENLTRCFPEVTVGLHVHGDLAIEPSRTKPANQTIKDFRRFLDDAFRPRLRALELEQQPKEEELALSKKPKVVVIFREGTRAVENENEVVKLCEDIGFQVEIVRPTVTMDVAIIYRALNSSDAMIGVVGAGMTHFLFQKPGDVFIQIVLLGTKWAAETSYGEPAKKMGLKYIPYRIKTWESSLSRIYNSSDPVIADPDSINRKGWDVAAKVYLQQQAVRVDIKRFRKFLVPAYQYIVAKKKAE